MSGKICIVTLPDCQCLSIALQSQRGTVRAVKRPPLEALSAALENLLIDAIGLW